MVGVLGLSVCVLQGLVCLYLDCGVSALSGVPDLEIKLLWWNVGLAPLGNEKKLLVGESEEMAKHLILMLRDLDLDLLCLGEVGAEFLECIEAVLDCSEYKVFNGVQTIDRVRFDSCVIYRSTKLAFQHAAPVVLNYMAASQKISHKLIYKVVATEEAFVLYVLHWPSRLSHGPEEAYRNFLGVNLRASVNQVFKMFGCSANIIALGDFNDEPFNGSMSNYLGASRDRRLVREREEFGFFYNPFWQFLVSPLKYNRSEASVPDFGTYAHSSSEAVTKSYVFDQMLFSSSFISKGPWHLEEDTVSIFDEGHAVAGRFVKAVGSDHLPIYAEVKRVMI